MADIIVSIPSWLIELNSEKSNGNKVNKIITVVFKTALPVIVSDLSSASDLFKPLIKLDL